MDKKLFKNIKNLFSGNNKQSEEEAKQIRRQKCDGTPYVEWFDEEYDEEYNKMNYEEKKQVDKMMQELEEIMNFDDDEDEVEP